MTESRKSHLTKRLRQGLSARGEGSERDGALSALNSSIPGLLEKFMTRVDAGEIQLDNIPDLVRVFDLFERVNDVHSGDGEGGALPELNLTQRHVIEENLEIGEDIVDGAGEVTQEGVVDVENMTEEDIAKLFGSLDRAQNKENEEAGL